MKTARSVRGALPGVRRVPRLAAGGAGLALAAGLGAVGLVRRDRPLHAYGAVTDATLTIDRAAGTGVGLLDVRGEHRVVCRLSRAMSLARRGPDIFGLALRVPDGGGRAADLLFAATGIGRWSRFVLRLGLDRTRRDLTTLLPLTTASGRLWLRLSPSSDVRYRLWWSSDDGAWHPAGQLVLDAAPTRDRPLRFDPVGAAPAGSSVPAPLRALRDPAYRVARRVHVERPAG